MTTYTCTQCGLQVVVEDSVSEFDSKAIKACGCKAPVTASISADMAGAGGVQ